MSIFLGDSEPSKIFVGDSEVSKVFVGDKQVRPATPVELPYLCFTANTAGSTVQLTKNGSPTVVTLETSTDGTNWTTYTIGDTITLSNIGDKVYWRNTSETDTGFSTGTSNLYQFVMSGSVAGSGDVNYLLNKNSTTTLSSAHCYRKLFYDCTALTSAPSLPATTLTNYCYASMFSGCTALETITQLPATTLTNYCYQYMFRGCTALIEIPSLPATTLERTCYYGMFYSCSNVKLSDTQDSSYTNQYRIPTEGTGTVAKDALTYMFLYTGGTFVGTPSINTTYYTSNTVV